MTYRTTSDAAWLAHPEYAHLLVRCEQALAEQSALASQLDEAIAHARHLCETCLRVGNEYFALVNNLRLAVAQNGLLVEARPGRATNG